MGGGGGGGVWGGGGVGGGGGQSSSLTLLTPEEADLLPDATAYELEDGVLKERDMATDANTVASNVHGELWMYARRVGGIAYADGLALRLWPGERRFVRADACYFAPGVLEPSAPGRKEMITTPPTIVVEVISPSDAAADVTRKTFDYLAAGVAAVWEVYPDSRAVFIRREGEPTQVLPETATIKDQPELPGFECEVASLFPPVIETEPEQD